MAEDQTGICWSDPCWPWRPLTRITALQYFEHSPFYDPNSNNAAARAQNLDPSNEAVLRSMPPDRPEFVLAEAQEPHVFVVRRQLRAPPPGVGVVGGAAGAPRAATQAVYYVLGEGAATYQAPSLHAAVNARLRRCMHFVRVGFGRFKRDLAPLPKLLRAQERQDAARAEFEAREALERSQLRAAVAGGALGVDTAAELAGAGVVGGGVPPLQTADAAPMAVPEVLTAAERRHWQRTDEIIPGVLRRYRAPRLPGEADAPDGGEQLKTEQEQQQQQQQQQAPAAQPKSEPAAEPRPGLPPPTSIKSEAPTGQPSARAASSAAASMPAPGAGYAASAAAATAARGALPSMSQGSVQPSGSVLTASRPPKVRIRMPRASGGSGSGGGAGPDSGEPAAKRAKQ